jgi:hypothetical protein
VGRRSTSAARFLYARGRTARDDPRGVPRHGASNIIPTAPISLPLVGAFSSRKRTFRDALF